MNVLAFFAHPDDETVLTGATLARLADAGANLHYLCATRGEGGEVGDPPLTTQDQLGEVREAELVCAVQALGGVRSLTFMDYIDPRVGPGEELYAFDADLERLAGQVAATIRQFEIDAVLSHGSDGEYGHPAHVLCHQAALTAVLSFGETERPALYTVQADFAGHPNERLANQSDAAHLVVDIDAWMDRKAAAGECHRTQHALFVRKASEDLGRPATVREAMARLPESLHRVWPAVVDGDVGQDGLFEILREQE